MSKTIRIKKGLDLRIKGSAELQTVDSTSIQDYAIKPTDFIGVTPRLLVKEGAEVKAGTPLLYDKNNEAVRFCSPVSGTVKAVVRGAKRAIMAVVVASDGNHTSENFEAAKSQSGREEIINTMLASGTWTLLKQRPFGIVADPNAKAKGIFISAFDSNPLAPDYDYMLKGREADFQKGLDVLSKLAKVHLGYNPELNKSAMFTAAKNVELHAFEGKHPAGLVGTQIAMTDPINKGEAVWTVNAQDVAIIGHLFATGEYRPEKLIAMAGPVVDKPQYYKIFAEANLLSITSAVTTNNVRFISGSVLSGSKIEKDDFLGYYDQMVSVLEEGNKYDFMGWLAPGFKKYSFSHTFVSGFFSHCGSNKKYLEGREMNTGMHGSVRPQVITGEFEKVMPLDIYPTQLIKACIIGDIDLMESLGIYEVEPEDFALCEFVDTSKNEIQSIIREGLELIRNNS